MGKAVSTLMRPIKTFNIENRAHKVISRDKPVRAPLLESTKKQLEIAKSVNPSFVENESKKNTELDKRLKNIFVQSRGPPTVEEFEIDPSRPLPLLTRSGRVFQYGFWEPAKAAEGKCTLGDAMEMMTKHMEDPLKYTAQEIATMYKLEIKDVENILEYYRVFKIVIPDNNPRLAYTDRSQIQSGPKKE